MSEAQLSILNYALLALVYLFFGRVLWTVWSELRGPRLAGQAARSTTAGATTAASGRMPRSSRDVPTRLVVVEPRVRRGSKFVIEGEVTIGRSTQCTIVLPDDQFASQQHTRVWADSGEAWVEDLGSTNGTALNGARLTGPERLRLGDRIQVGNTLFEADR